MNLPVSKPALDGATKFVATNLWTIFFVIAILTIFYNLINNIVEQRDQIRTIAMQNPACIYLEKSDLEGDQHYMICEGQILLKRVTVDTEAEPTEVKLEKVLSPESTEPKSEK